MSVCKSVYPEVVTEYSIPTNFDRFLSGNPKDNFDKNKLSTITILNNTLLKNSDLSQYPRLSERINQGTITDEEFADFLSDKSIDLDFVKDTYLTNFPVEVDYDSVKTLVQTTEQAITETINAGQGFRFSTDIPTNIRVIDRDGSSIIIDGYNITDESGVTYNIKEIHLTIDGEIVGGGNITTVEGVTFFIDPQTAIANPKFDDNSTIASSDPFLQGNFDLTPVTPPSVVQAPALIWTPNADILDLFELQEDYYRENFSSNFNKNACGSFSNPFAKLADLVSLISIAKDLSKGTIGSFSDVTQLIGNLDDALGNSVLSRISGLGDKITTLVNDIKRYGDLSNVIESLKSKLNDFKNQIVDQVDKIVKTMKAQIAQIQNKVNQLKNIGKGISKFLNKKATELTKFFSKDNIDKLKEKAKDFFTFNEQQFEDLIPSVLNFLLLKGCGLSGLIENILRGPVDAFKNLASNLTQNFDIMKSHSAEVRNSVLSVGGLRMIPEQREADVRRARDNYNNTPNSPGNIGDNAPVLPDAVQLEPTPEERSAVNKNVSKDGWSGYFNLSEKNVQHMGKRAREDYENFKKTGRGLKYPNRKIRFGISRGQTWGEGKNFHDAETGLDDGFNKVKPDVWVKLKRVVERMQNAGVIGANQELTVNSAFRSKYYNYFMCGGARFSNHMDGVALDISKSDMGGDRGQAAFIQACSDEGFTAIVNYQSDGFFHIDLDGGRTKNWTGDNKKLGKLARAAWERHSGVKL